MNEIIRLLDPNPIHFGAKCGEYRLKIINKKPKKQFTLFNVVGSRAINQNYQSV